MEKIDFTTDVKIGETVVTEIIVHPLRFLTLVSLWEVASSRPGKAETNLQRERIINQTHFCEGGNRLTPALSDIMQLPIPVAKSIIAALDKGNGKMGKVLAEGDGVTSAVIYELGTPIKMTDSQKKEIVIKEIEFKASTYGEVEDILSGDNSLTRTAELLKIAAPVGVEGLTRLPGWAIDRITASDGTMIMNKVLPRF